MQTFEQFWYDVQKYKLKTKHHFYVLSTRFKDTNGCGAKGGIDFPDSLWGCHIGPACSLHDISWEMAECYEDLIEGNTDFRHNMEKIIDTYSANRFTQWIRLKTMSRYYRMVKLIGTPIHARKRGFIL